MPLTGGFAALLLATLPGFFTFCRSSMSEISACALIVLAFMFAYLGLEEERRWKIYLSAIFLGLSLNVRPQALFFAPLLLAMALFPNQGRHLSWLLHCVALIDRLRSVGRPEPGAKYDSISFALRDGVRFLARWRLVAKVRDLFAPTHPKQCCHSMERIDAPPQTVFGGQLFWHRHHLCCPICPFSLRGSILHPTQPVRDLRFSSWFKFLCFDLVYSSRVGRLRGTTCRF